MAALAAANASPRMVRTKNSRWLTCATEFLLDIFIFPFTESPLCTLAGFAAPHPADNEPGQRHHDAPQQRERTLFIDYPDAKTEMIDHSLYAPHN